VTTTAESEPMPGFKTLKLETAPTTRDEDTGADWITLRHQLGVQAFGINAWRAPEAGVQVIVDHDEADSLHQEIYVVVSGEATFTIDGHTVDAPAGTVIFIEDPNLQRVGIAKQPGTTVLTVGAQPGRIFTPSSWESALIEGSGS
jgi:mannose-6-phosphate isomerase-like protein (cupin superfamily)